MTVNKSQSQTLKAVGIFLPRPVFVHGQLYVAMSRVGAEEHIKILVTHNTPIDFEKLSGVFTRNVVYDEVL